ncbi:MAG TPA: DEAD/DEAH box helicase, partial [Candidatus Binatia bacterium]|nr:DEAD/DEAH box helicase [Candidatus Binatia bacterium]
MKRPEGRAPFVTLLDYLPKETIFVLCDSESLAVHADSYEQQVAADDPFFISWPDFLAELNRRGLTSVELLDDVVPLTPALSLGEREKSSQFSGDITGKFNPEDNGSHGKSKAEICSNDSHKPESDRRLFPLPGGEGQGEGEAGDAQENQLVFSNLDAFRPLAERAPEPQIAEAQRREFFQQLHRWLRQDYAVHVFCNNDGERQRFEEIWAELGLGSGVPVPGGDIQVISPRTPDAKRHPQIRIGPLARGFICDEAKLVVVTDAEIFGRYKVQRPRRQKSAHALAARSALDIDFTDLEDGDLVVHLQHGIGRYLGLKNLPALSGGSRTETADAGRQPPDAGTECLVIEYAPSDPANEPPKLYVPVSEAHLVSKYVGAGKAHPPLNTLGGTRWNKAKEQAEKSVRDVAAELLRIQAVRESQPGHACQPDTQWQREFESSFIYEETRDQITAIAETKADQERPKPMDRLICGDVGFGKTEVAIRAAFKAVMDGKQVAILVPTTVLAQQHFNNFRERMADYPIRVELLSRFRTRRDQNRVLKDLAAG